MRSGRRETRDCLARKLPRRRRLPQQRQARHGNSSSDFVENDCSGIRWTSPALFHVVVAGNRALLSPAGPCGGRAGFAARVLAGDWIGIWHVVSIGRWAGSAALSRLLLSRRAHHDRAFYLDLYDDVRN